MNDLFWGIGAFAAFSSIVIFDTITGSKDKFTDKKYNLKYEDYEHRYRSGGGYSSSSSHSNTYIYVDNRPRRKSYPLSWYAS